MQLFVKVMWFTLFLVAFGAWITAGFFLLLRILNNPAFGRSLWSAATMVILNYVGMFLFVYLLSGFWNWSLVALFLFVSQVGIALSWVLNELFGSNAVKWKSRA